MLRVVFIGYDNRLNRCVARRLAHEADAVGDVWLNGAARWHTSWKGRREFLKRRLKRRGLIKAIDEIAYFAYDRATARRSKNTYDSYVMANKYWDSFTEPYVAAPAVYTDNVNNPDVVEWVASLKPDLIFAHCINQYFSKKLRAAARLGIMMLHVGITPEYKGLYSPFWTLYNEDYDKLGYSVIHINDDLDAGDIYLQRRLTNVDVRNDNHTLIEHKAILDSLDYIGPLFRALESGAARPIQRVDAQEGYYSYPGLTDFIVQRLRARRAQPPQTTHPTLTNADAS